jgi:hypothetical protein
VALAVAARRELREVGRRERSTGARTAEIAGLRRLRRRGVAIRATVGGRGSPGSAVMYVSLPSVQPWFPIAARTMMIPVTTYAFFMFAPPGASFSERRADPATGLFFNDFEGQPPHRIDSCRCPGPRPRE